MLARAVVSLLLLALLAVTGLEAITSTRPTRARGAALGEYSQPRDVRIVDERAADPHDHSDGDDAHSDEGTDTAQCVVNKMKLVVAFNEVAAELNVTGVDGELCSLPVPQCHHHANDDDHHEDDEGEDHHDNDEDGDHHDDDDEKREVDHHDNEEEGGHHDEDKDHITGSGGNRGNDTDSGCLSVYDTCVELLLHTNLLSASCLSGECDDNSSSTSTSSDDRPSSAEAYGYGFLMVTLVSLGSLLGIIVVPLTTGSKKSARKLLLYKYVYFFMIALGISALLSDAVLHLLPHAWELHAHGEAEDAGDSHGHGHSDDSKVTVEQFLWKGSVALLAIYLFYLLEFFLHGFSSHTHSHGFLTDTATDCHDDGKECIQLDTSVPHGQCGGTSDSGNILHPASTETRRSSQNSLSPKPLVTNENGHASVDIEVKQKSGLVGRVMRIKPLAWLIIVGDGIHNFTDGLALGAAISQSLTLGISTTIALIFHEIPHEFGDYVILLSTGFTWYTALMFNFISALSAVIGFFIGVAIGTESEAVNGWILAFAAGLFVYIALVDLLPELIHSKETGPHRWGLFCAANIGFFISFLALFLLAMFEEDLNTLID